MPAARSATRRERPSRHPPYQGPPSRRRSGARTIASSKRGEAGYSLVVLIVAITVMTILAAASLPMWSKQIQRDREEELISRGWQYAEAIRLFQNRFGRLPITLDELSNAKPRCLRHRYKDPMTGDDFDPLPQGMPQMPVTPKDPAQGQGQGQDTKDPGQQGAAQKPKTVVAGPFLGVHSHSDKTSSLLFYGQDRYDAWWFTVQRLGGASFAGGARVGGGPGALVKGTRWLGRPPLEGGNPFPFQNPGPGSKTTGTAGGSASGPGG